MNTTDAPASGGPALAERATPERGRLGLLIAALAGVLALLVCAALVVQISYRRDGWPGVYAATLHGGFRGPYGSYPAPPPTGLPTGYRIGVITHADRSYLFGGLRIDVTRTDVTAVRVSTGTRYWQYHRETRSRVVAAATDVARGDVFLAWQPADETVVRLERIDVRAGRSRWRQELRRMPGPANAPAVPPETDRSRQAPAVPPETDHSGHAPVVPPETDHSGQAPAVLPGADRSGQVAVFLWGAEAVGIDRATGRRRWSVPLACAFGGGAAAESGVVVVGLACAGGRVAAAGIDAATGVQRWVTRQVDGDRAQVVALGGGRVVVPSLRDRPVLDVGDGLVVESLPEWDPGIVVDENTKRRFSLLHRASPAMGIGEIGSTEWRAEIPLPTEVVGARLAEVQSGVALLTTATGQITLIPFVPSTVQSIAK